MATAPLLYRAHAASARLLFALWPFSRLAHGWSPPVQYLGRPYILYRRRAVRGMSGMGMHLHQGSVANQAANPTITRLRIRLSADRRMERRCNIRRRADAAESAAPSCSS